MSAKIDFYFARGSITAKQARAGRMWKGDFDEQASLRHRGFERRPAASSRHDGLHMPTFSRMRYRQAGDALGPLRHLAFAIIIEERDAVELAEEMSEPIGAIVPMLRMALNRLVDFYEVKETV